MKNQEREYPHLSDWIKHTSRLLRLTRDEIVRSTGMCNDKASAVWNGKDIRLSYYLVVLKLLFQRSDNGRYKLTRRQLIESLIEVLQKELENIWIIRNFGKLFVSLQKVK